MTKYFPSLVINEYDWVRNPFAVTSDVISHLELVEQEQLLELQSDRSLKLKFNELKLFQFWSFIKTEYPIITEIAINILLPFSTTYLCELGFSALTNIKNKKREQLLSVEQEMRVCLSSIPPRTELLCKQHQAHVSHQNL
ncbi:protein FAM200A-like [Sipha flava]|uniref:Protein FAM200A-like n=1 Tax=Sipha flava TaxID=143950 RepID=A0A8B8FRV4_9HEMI|nr:protein FAM200A-like [Sipha flava]